MYPGIWLLHDLQYVIVAHRTESYELFTLQSLSQLGIHDPG
jgi:hypothetical protein